MPIASEDYLDIFDKLYAKIQDNAVTELNNGRITDKQYAVLLTQSQVALINQAINLYMNADKINAETELAIKGKEKVDAETASTFTGDAIKQATWNIQKGIMEEQKKVVQADARNREAQLQADIAYKLAQIAQAEADKDFTERKAQTMEDTREDNVRMQAAREFAEFMKYISAADVVPAEEDFKNLRKLIFGISNKTAITGIEEYDSGTTSWVAVSDTDKLRVPDGTSFQTKPA